MPMHNGNSQTYIALKNWPWYWYSHNDNGDWVLYCRCLCSWNSNENNNSRMRVGQESAHMFTLNLKLILNEIIIIMELQYEADWLAGSSTMSVFSITMLMMMISNRKYYHYWMSALPESFIHVVIIRNATPRCYHYLFRFRLNSRRFACVSECVRLG